MLAGIFILNLFHECRKCNFSKIGKKAKKSNQVFSFFERRTKRGKIIYLEKEIQDIQTEKVAIKTDSNTLEKYARETYFMKHPNEEVFVFDTLQSK
jgi:hypothetical protein